MVRVHFTDYAVSKSTEVLRRVIGIELPLARGGEVGDFEDEFRQRQLTGASATAEGSSHEEGTVIDVDPEDTKVEPVGAEQKDVNPDRAHLRQIFFHEGENLVLDDLRLKASSQVDAARRLVFLLLYAHELEGRRQIPRDDINAALKDVGLFDPNIINWISTTADLREENIKDVSGTGRSVIRLRRTGREEAQRILHQMLDPNVPNAWPLSDRTRARGGKAAAPDSSGSEKATKSQGRGGGRKANPAVDTWVTKWNSLGLHVDGHSICNDSKVPLANKGILGLWAIRRATDDTVTVVSGSDLMSFINKAFVVQIDRRNITRALESKDGKGKVIRRQTGYELNPTGIQDAQTIAGLTAAADGGIGKSKSSSKKKA